MLVITRKEGEEIIIKDSYGREIARVRVASLSGNRVQLGLIAKHEIGFTRAELENGPDGRRA